MGEKVATVFEGPLPDVGLLSMCCRHLARVPDYLWVAEDGMKMQGYNGSQLWDTAFSVQGIVATGLWNEIGECLKMAHQYIDMTQVSVNAAMLTARQTHCEMKMRLLGLQTSPVALCENGVTLLESVP